MMMMMMMVVVYILTLNFSYEYFITFLLHLTKTLTTRIISI